MINLNDAKIGDKLLTKHGAIAVYLGKSDNPHNSLWQHEIVFLSGTVECKVNGKAETIELIGSYGTRTDDGFTFSNPESRLEQDHDIVAILGRHYKV